MEDIIREDDVRLWDGRSLRDANDALLARLLEDYLREIAETLRPWGMSPTREGYPAAGWYDQYSTISTTQDMVARVRRLERMARAIRVEQARRARPEWQRQAAYVRLENIVEYGPATLWLNAITVAPDVAAASERVRAFVKDLRLMMEYADLGERLDDIRECVGIAADRLGRPTPQMLPNHDGLPTEDEVREILDLLTGRAKVDRKAPVLNTEGGKDALLAAGGSVPRQLEPAGHCEGRVTGAGEKASILFFNRRR